MSNRGFFTILITLLLLVVGSKSIYIVDQTEKALVLRFGKVLRDSENIPVVNDPGLHFKAPFVDSIVILDKRVQLMDGSPDVFTTQNKEFLEVDTYVQWKVVDFAKFYIRTNGNFKNAEDFLENYVDNGLRNQFGNRTLEQAVSGEREELMDEIKSFVNQADKAPEYGMEVVDIRVKKVNYTPRVLANVYEQIKSERRAQAVKIRSEGQQEANITIAKTDAEVLRTLANADEYARTVKGNADAEAAKIYANTYNKNPEFYAFLRSLDAYKASFNKQGDIIVVQPDSDFFKYFKDAKGKKSK
ncbi:protease modulator HflC [Aliikangiella sp. G2MR2-5]|uniref:protease modulator HflC n=1 Tax=Aliikangiella sp. G2MR2-5 TaxID=2788943 RepID=UPI0018ABF325|nr:protease modulator HflC [Aliikangiella sp. G2MR2-5]